MHLIALEQEPTSQRGGQELNLLEICHGLKRRGHRVSLLYERPGNLLDRYRDFCDHTIRVSRYGFDRRKFNDVLNFLPSLAQIGTIPTYEDSIIFSNVYHTVFWGYLLSLARQLPFACYLQVPPFDFNRQRLLGLKGVDRFIAVSEQTKQNWCKLGYDPEKIDVVLNGTDPERFKPAADFAEMRSQWHIPQDTRVITFVGRLDHDKGLETLLQAFQILSKTTQNIRLLIAGKPLLHINPKNYQECPEERLKYQQSLQNLAVALGIQEQVTFLGHITDTQSLYQVSDVTVVPSRFPDPCPRVVIETMSCGTPVVASRIGGIPEVLTGEFAANLVDPENPQDLAQVLESVMNWRDQDPKLGDRCRSHVLSQFSFEKMLDGIEKLLLNMAATSVKTPVGASH